LQMLSGNAQLLKIHEQKDVLALNLASWKKNADAIVKRLPAWERLLDLHAFAAGLSEGVACEKSIAAIVDGRTLLGEPDPIPDLTKKLTTALRNALGKLQSDLALAFEAGERKISTAEVWGRLNDDQRSALTATYQLNPPARETIGTEDEILSALRSGSLADRRNLLDAVPQRFARAVDEAGRLLEPKAQRVTLPSATIRTSGDLDIWLSNAKMQIEDKLKDGPVIL
jgi:hypothetical protein